LEAADHSVGFLFPAIGCVEEDGQRGFQGLFFVLPREVAIFQPVKDDVHHDQQFLFTKGLHEEPIGLGGSRLLQHALLEMRGKVDEGLVDFCEPASEVDAREGTIEGDVDQDDIRAMFIDEPQRVLHVVGYSADVVTFT
jgi:hypothetical protein